MPSLAAPDPRFQRSFLVAVEEYAGEAGWERQAGLVIFEASEHHPGERYIVEELADPEIFAAYCGRLARLDDPATLPPLMVPSTVLWWVEGDEYLGRISVRHELTPFLLEVAGHIGYGVRPTARRRGHATAMLAAVLPVANAVGIDPVLVTCDDINVASRKVIEAAGGVLEDKRGVKLRYWVPTS